MIRAPLGDREYWREWEAFRKERLQKEWSLIRKPSPNPQYEPQYVFDTAKSGQLRYLLTCYSSGAPIGKLAELFPPILDAWEISNNHAKAVEKDRPGKKCRDWIFDLSDLNHYNWCFWLIGLALAFEINDEQWKRLLLLVDGEGKDVLLDRIIATRQPMRKIGLDLLHAKPYERLLATIDASPEKQAHLLLEFLTHWYGELERSQTKELWWYGYGDSEKHPLSGGGYFGRWCIEAVAAVKAFGIDDALCLGHENYPGDLLRPNGPTTHQAPAVKTKFVIDRFKDLVSGRFGKARP